MAVLVLSSVVMAEDTDDYIDFCLQREKGQVLKQELLSSQSGEDPLVIRDMIWTSADPQKGASSALDLMEALIPGGDPSRIDEVKGFINNDETLPRQVIAIESSLAAMSFLVDMRKPESLWLAHDIFMELKKTSAFAQLRERVDGQEYNALNRVMSQAKELHGLMSNGSSLWKDSQRKILPMSVGRVEGQGANSNLVNSNMLVTLNKEGQISREKVSLGWDAGSGTIAPVKEGSPSGDGGSGSGNDGSGSGGSGGSGGSSGG
jgi:hypothetical protein